MLFISNQEKKFQGGHKMKKYLILLINIILITYLYASNEWTFFNQSNTLFPSNPYKVIVIDDNNNKWIGTEYNGLLKFDGTNWDSYTITNSNLSSNKINNMIFDEHQNLWIATTNGGLVKKDLANTFTVYNSTNSFLPTNNINHIDIDPFKSKWIGTKQGLVFLDIYENYNTFNMTNSGLPSNDITTVKTVTEYFLKDSWNNESTGTDSLDIHYTKWIGTTQGLVRYDNFSWEVFTTSNSVITGNGITALTIDNKKNKWVGVYNWNSNSGGGLIKIDSTNTQWTVFTINNSQLPSNNIRSINYEIDNLGNPIIWIATDNGIAKLINNNWTIYNKDNTQNNLTTNDIYSVSIENNMRWFGTNFNMMKFAESAWTNFSILNAGIPNNNITDIFIDTGINYSHKWIATKNGLTRFNGTNWKVFNTANSLISSNDIKSIALDNDKILWIGTQQFGNIGGGLCAYNSINDEWEIFNTVNSPLTSNSINKVIVSYNTNKKWIGTAGGGLLSYDNNGNWEIFTTTNSQINSDYIQDLYIDSSNKLWIAGDYGLTVFDSNNNFLITYNTYNSNLPVNNIKKVKQDRLGYIWAITSNSIGKLINNEWVIYNSTNSSLTGTITDISFDSNNIKWITTSNGLFRTDEMKWVVFNLNNSQIISNNLSAIKIEQIIQNNKIYNFKWLATDSGIGIFKGAEQQFKNGAYLSVYQHQITPNVLSFSAIVNNVLVDSVHFKVNNKYISNTEIAQNTWISSYTAEKSENISVVFKYFSDSRDSTVTKNLNISLLNISSPSAKANKFNLSLLNSIDKDSWLLSFNEEDELLIPDLSPEVVNNLMIEYSHINSEKFVFQYKDETDWIDIESIVSNNSVASIISKSGRYRIHLKEDDIPVFDNVSIYPNPFILSQGTKSTLSMSIDLNDSSHLCVEVYNVKGQKIKTLYDEISMKGQKIVSWNGKNEQNKLVSSGIYFLRVKNIHNSKFYKIVLIK